MSKSPLRRFFAWIFDNLLWDTTGSARSGFAGAMWATRKILIAGAAAVFLTWREWLEYEPHQIMLAALMHFAFVLTAIGFLVYSLQRLGRADKKLLRSESDYRGKK
ncbi:MAG TPA: hypothetical protein VE866_12950 [Candidatus Binatia bacterium]|jgi:hypothetical protein|nr:hypothetical protein [Candidatus Binatia bacterium]